MHAILYSRIFTEVYKIHTHTHTHTHIYIYICMTEPSYEVGKNGKWLNIIKRR